MTVVVDVSTSGVRTPLSRDAIATIASATLRRERVRHALVSIALVDRAAIARLNREHLDHAGPTDVISFGFSRATPRDPVVGDVYIAPQVAAANARARGVGVREEIARLVIHGLLHVLGHDHPDGAEREQSTMWRRQERILRALAKPRAVRRRRAR